MLLGHLVQGFKANSLHPHATLLMPFISRQPMLTVSDVTLCMVPSNDLWMYCLVQYTVSFA